MDTVLLIGTLDTKGAEYAYVRDLLVAGGCDVVLMDLGVLGEPALAPDISADEVAQAGGSTLELLRARGDRGNAVEVMLAGARTLVPRLYAAGRFQGVLGLGGGGGTTMIAAALRELPVGVPKLLVSTMASGNTAPYVDVKDITLMYSVVDIAGLNPLSRRILANAAGAIGGMVRQVVPARRGGDSAPERSRADAARPESQAPARRGGDSAPERSRADAARPESQAPARRGGDSAPERSRADAARPEPQAPGARDRPLLAATMFGVTTPCVNVARARLEEAGYDVVVFHATGTGGRAMEGLIRDGHFAGVLDVTTTEWCDEVVGGVLSAGPDRLGAAAERGIPQVVSVGALDMVNFGGIETVPAQFRDRTLYRHNPTVTLMRTTPAECAEIGRRIAAQLNRATGPTVLMLPLRGVSMIDADGQPFHDPAADAALFDTLRTEVDRSRVQLIEVDAHINDPAFAESLASELLTRLQPAVPAPVYEHAPAPPPVG